MSQAAVTTSNDLPAQPRKRRSALQILLRSKVSLLCFLVILIFVLLAVFAPYLPIADPNAINSPARLAGVGQGGYIFGADELGRDLFSRIVWGGRISLSAGLGAAGVALLIGTTVGLVAGFYGRWVDALLMRVTDVVLAFPSVLLAIGIVAALGPGLFNAMLAVAIAGFPLYARVVRGSVLTVRELDYVEAARSLGFSNWRIMIRHILPNVIAPILVTLSLDIGQKIVTTSSLSFLGLGAQPPIADWGNMIASGREYIRTAPHLVILPGAVIFAIVLVLNILGDRLRDILDPRTRSGSAK